MGTAKMVSKTNCKTWLIIVLLGLASIIAYSNIMRNNFVWDDNVFIKKNYFIKDFSNITKVFHVDFWEASARSQKATFYRPLIIASLIFDYAVWKDNPFGYHLFNIFFHALTSIILFYIACLFMSRTGAFITALVFAVHPIHTESVTFILGRTDVLSAFFMFTAVNFFFYSHLKQENNIFKIPLFWAGVTSYLLSLFCKEASIIAMPIIVLIWFMFLRKIQFKKLCVSLIPFVVVILIYMLIRFMVYYGGPELFHTTPGGTKFFTFLTMTKIFVVYIGKLLVPIRQSIDYKPAIITSLLSPVFIISTVTLIGLLACAVLAYRSGKKIFSFSVFWFFITIMPVSNIISIGLFIADRFLYIPSFGLCVLTGGVFDYLFIKYKDNLRIRRACFIFLFTIILCFTVLTVRRNFDWVVPFRFWLKTAKTTPESYRAHGSLGLIYMHRNDMKRAVYHSQKALLYNPTDSRVLGNTAVLYMELQDYERAVFYLNKAIEQDPRDFRSYANLFAIYEYIDQPAKALYSITRAIDLSPGNFQLHMMKANYLRDKKQIDASIDTLKDFLRQSPDNIDALLLVADIFFNEKNDFTTTEKVCRKILSIDPNNRLAQNLLAKCMALKNSP